MKYIYFNIFESGYSDLKNIMIDTAEEWFDSKLVNLLIYQIQRLA